MSGAARRWLWITAIWTGIGLFDATQNVFGMRAEGMHHSWVQLFFVLSLAWIPWALATPWVIELGRRYRPVKLKPVSTWLVHAGALLAIAAAAAAWVALLEVLLQPWAPDAASGPYLTTWLLKLSSHSLSSLILYAFILVISVALDSRERLATQQTETARLNEQLSQAHMNALRRQMEPHFIFNTLNAIAGLVRENKGGAAVSMIVALSDFLRRVVKDCNDPQVPLSQEVEFLERYLAIQKMRFAGRLRVGVQVPGALLAARVPSLILQPLVENAIKHGIAKRVQGGAVRIAACSGGGMLRLSVYNDGPAIARGGEAARTGTGLANLRKRLTLLYGGKFELHLENQRSAGVEASVSLPYREG
jgi:LytS/YehU family sensor histidine kinase